jgi:acyl-CoA dehydrogenase
MSVLGIPDPACMSDEGVQLFRDNVSRFMNDHAPPERTAKWRAEGQVERAFWREAGGAGLLGVSIPEEYGGAGGDFRHDVIVFEQIMRKNASGFGAPLHNGIVAPYVLAHGTEEQKRRWLPSLCKGERIAAIAMSEPSTGSDLQNIRTTARRVDDGYVINGAKTFISNGQLASFVVVAAKTDPTQGARGISLLVVEAENAQGFRRGRKLKKIGQDAADTSELFFDEVWVPKSNLLGMQEGQGFRQLMTELPRERLIIALNAMTSIEIALETTLAYVKERTTFGQPILSFQNTQFRLADLKTEAAAAKTFVNFCLEQLFAGKLDVTLASMAKLLTTELQGKVVDQCLQFHGGYGYMEDYLIARLYRDARVTRIFGCSNEIMRLIVARSL